jgi:alkane 1-monooxygenase
MVLPYFTISCVILADIMANHFIDKPLFDFWFGFSLLPLIDQILPLANFTPSHVEQKLLKKQKIWKLPLITAMLAEWLHLFYCLYKVSFGNVTTATFIFLVMGSGGIGAKGFLVGHESFHKRNNFSRVIGALHLSKSLYMQFFIEHVYSHHKNVGTPLDTSTARLGQSIFSFIPQSMKGTIMNTWRYEAKRLNTSWTIYNRNFWFFAVEASLAAVVWCIFGKIGLLYLVCQAFASISLMEVVNYVEHYGLVRNEVAPGVYEPISIKHSWNAPQLLQNWYLFKLQLHSDHHENPLKPYQALYSYEVSPQLPCGYGVCIAAATCPPVWFSIINPIANLVNKNGLTTPEDLKRGETILRRFIVVQIVLVTWAISLI